MLIFEIDGFLTEVRDLY